MAPHRPHFIVGLYTMFVLLIVTAATDTIRLKRSSCSQTTCPPGSRCVDDTTSGGTRCQCYSGYVPPTCKDRNECALVKTLCHNGTCLNTPGSFVCLCNDGYNGSRCTNDVDECQSSPCLNNNTCINTPGSYQCRCYSGYLAPDCRDRDECAIARNLCNNGTCVNTHGSYRCDCHDGFTGSHCTHREPCASHPCQNGGTCSPGVDVDSYSCRCYVGFNHSSNCEDINECKLASKTCFHGTCVNTLGSFKCACADGYSGLHCQEKIDFCESAPCLNGGTCMLQQSGYRCNCFEGFNNSANCIDINECLLDPHFCRNGSCMNTPGSFKCDCNHGYQGQRCTDDTDECQSNPCVHGICVNSQGSYTCNCFDGFSGQTCSLVTTKSTTKATITQSKTTSTTKPSGTPTTVKQPTTRAILAPTTITTPSSVPTINVISSQGRSQANRQDKSWVSTHYWIIVVIAGVIVAVGGAVFGFRRRRRKIPYKMFGKDNGISVRFHNKDTPTDVVPSSSCTPTTSVEKYINLKTADDIQVSQVEFISKAGDIPDQQSLTGYNEHEAGESMA